MIIIYINSELYIYIYIYIKQCKIKLTDEETECLLKIVKDYKSEKDISGIDWNSVKNKYDEIRVKLVAAYPVGSDKHKKQSNKSTTPGFWPLNLTQDVPSAKKDTSPHP